MPDRPAKRPARRTMRRLWALTLPGERRVLALIVVSGLAAAALEGAGLALLIPATAIALGQDVPMLGGPVRMILGDDVSLAAVLAIAGVAIGAGLVLGLVNLVASTRLSMTFAGRLRDTVFEGPLTERVVTLETRPTGKLLNVLATETWRTSDALFVAVALVSDAVAALVLLVLLATISPLYTAVVIVLAAGAGWAIGWVGRDLSRLGARATAANAAFTRQAWSALAGLRTIRGFGRAAYERHRFARRSAQVTRLQTRVLVLARMSGRLGQLFAVLMVAALAGLAALRGDPAAPLVGFLAVAYRMQPRLSALMQNNATLRGLDGSVAEVEAAIARTPPPRPRGAPVAPVERDIMLDTVTVRYPGAARPALDAVSCRLEHGRVTAVAGRSGAGKSTLMATLLGFVAPESGRVLVDGRDLATLDPDAWNARVAFVEQDAFLFDASASANIGYARPGASTADIRRAAGIARIHDTIMDLDGGYGARLGENGVTLSLGQRQRIAFARAILRDPDVLILDEATNALDRVTERELRAALARAGRPRIVIVIAHRLETVAAADTVVVLDDGRVVETGTPAALARAGGLYARLYAEDPPA